MKINATTLVIIAIVAVAGWYIYNQILQTRLALQNAADNMPKVPSGPFSRIGLGLDVTASGLMDVKTGISNVVNEIW